MPNMPAKTSHTPGPWTIDKYGNVKAPGNQSLLVNGVSLPCGNHPDIEEARANSRLLAASPDLLTYLKEACEVLTEHEIAGSHYNIQHMLAAIRRAEGGGS